MKTFLLDNLSDGRRNSLFNVVWLEVWQAEDKLGTGLEIRKNRDFLQQLLLTNVHNIGLLNSVRGLDGLLGAADISANNATLNKIVMHRVDVDVVGRLASKEAANGRRSSSGRRIVHIPERVLLTLLHEDEVCLVDWRILVGDLLNDRGDGVGSVHLGSSILDVNDGGLTCPLIGERDRSDDVRIESRADGGVLNRQVVTDLTKHRNLLHRSGQDVQESLFNEGSIDADANDANFLASGSKTADNLLGKLRLDATENDKDGLW